MKLKKILASILCAAMVLSTMSFSVFANEEYPTDVWDGTADTDWYDAENPQDEYTLETAEQLAGFAQLVTGGIAFDDTKVLLGANIDLDNNSFNPIGTEQNRFKGIFDAQGNTISNMFINGDLIGYGYGNASGIGLFGAVEDAVIKNLVINGANLYQYAGILGTVTGHAFDDCVFENITVSNTLVKNYNWYTGGVVGCAVGEQTYKGIVVEENTTIESVWASWDTMLGGVIGGIDPGCNINFIDCDIACRIDGYNDYTSSYKWGGYRCSGMLIGYLPNETQVQTGTGAVYNTNPTNVACENVNVVIGDWANYTYIDTTGSGGWKRVESASSYEGVDIELYPDAEVADYLYFDQIFGGLQSNQYAGYYGANEKELAGFDYFESNTLTVTDNAKYSKSVATIGYDYYPTLTDAASAANDGDVITLIKNVKENAVLGDVSGVSLMAEGDPIVIDLNGFTITPEDESLAVLNNGGNFVIKNGTIVGNIENNGDTLEIQDVTVEGDVVINAGTVNITDGVFEGTITVEDTATLVISGGQFAEATDELHLADGLIWAADEYGYMIPVADDAGNGLAVTENITVSLEPTENANKYDVVLTADDNTEIHRFLSAELNITLTPDGADKTPISIKNIVGNEEYGVEVIKPEYNTSTIWGFHLGEATDITVKEFTGSELTIATIELAGYGEGELTVAAHANNKVQAIQSKDNNNVKFYTVDATTLVLPTEADEINLLVPTKALTIEITFVNPIEDQVKAYQDMTVTVEGKDIETITKELGTDGDVQLVTSADGKIVQYVITLNDELTENNSYNIKVEGAGYRTAEYRVTMTEDKIVYFWNDASKDGKEIEKDVSAPVKATFLAGDIAEDNIIDKYDLAAVVSYFGKYDLTSSDATYKYAKYDLNRDGNIDSEDIAYVLASFGY